MLAGHSSSTAHPGRLNSSGKEWATAFMLDFDGSRHEPPAVRVLPAERETGTPVLWQREDEFLVACLGHCQTLGQERKLFSGAWLRRAFERPDLLTDLSRD